MRRFVEEDVRLALTLDLNENQQITQARMIRDNDNSSFLTMAADCVQQVTVFFFLSLRFK